MHAAERRSPHQPTPAGARRPNRGPSAAAANRAALLAAAEEVFGELGYGAPLHLVARRAGVGQGSLYRHFPDRIGLAVAVFERNLAEMVAFAELPTTGVEEMLNRIGVVTASAVPLFEMVVADAEDPRVARLGELQQTATDLVFERDRARGLLSPDTTVEHLKLAIQFTAASVAKAPPEERADTRRRVLELMLAGLRGLRLQDDNTDQYDVHDNDADDDREEGSTEQ